jgi:hypothetical protein
MLTLPKRYFVFLLLIPWQYWTHCPLPPSVTWSLTMCWSSLSPRCSVRCQKLPPHWLPRQSPCFPSFPGCVFLVLVLLLSWSSTHTSNVGPLEPQCGVFSSVSQPWLCLEIICKLCLKILTRMGPKHQYFEDAICFLFSGFVFLLGSPAKGITSLFLHLFKLEILPSSSLPTDH